MSGVCTGLSDKGCSVADAGDGSVGLEFCSAYLEDDAARCCIFDTLLDCADLGDKGCSVADAGGGSVGQEFCSAYPEDDVARCCVADAFLANQRIP